jgi:hypothetical protein
MSCGLHIRGSLCSNQTEWSLRTKLLMPIVFFISFDSCTCFWMHCSSLSWLSLTLCSTLHLANDNACHVAYLIISCHWSEFTHVIFVRSCVRTIFPGRCELELFFVCGCWSPTRNLRFSLQYCASLLCDYWPVWRFYEQLQQKRQHFQESLWFI